MNGETVMTMTVDAIITTVGGPSAPIIEMIEHFQPDYVGFIVSAGESGSVYQLKRPDGAPGEILKQTEDLDFRFDVFPIDNAEALNASFITALRAIQRVRHDFEPERVLIGYSCGTTPMRTALVLAAMEDDFRFADLNDGTQQPSEYDYDEVHLQSTPQLASGLNALRRALAFFNRHSYSDALRIVEDAGAKIEGYGPLADIVANLENLCKAYARWDAFDYRAAHRLLANCRVANFNTSTRDLIEENRDYLDALLEHSNQLETISQELLWDLYANAMRRASEGRYDDAMARLYRALEAFAQYRLQELGHDATDLDSKTLPSQLRQRYEAYRNGRTKRVSLSLTAMYELLYELNDDAGRHFFEDHNGFIDHLAQRRDSILAKGASSQSKSSYVAFRTEVESFLENAGLEPLQPLFPRFSATIVDILFQSTAA